MRMTWLDMCRSDEYRGRWVALDNIDYEDGSSQPQQADVVDSDEDLGELCSRMRESDRTACAILYCEDDSFAPPVARRAAMPTRGAVHR
ncbi:hypothetical protein [Polyangium jinanense]|uniref:Uncharacterized protein n=1 Tax=Polyangium jinanense TaxID=2829994 RepID=A0A9X3XAH9_9BACT|nr:hypothetical protein [Polyangium jinanense]MDC3986642.1 hypothetical protein [Polyangium jinanense]